MTNKPTSRLYALDLLRFLAAIGVMLCHYNGYFGYFGKTAYSFLFANGYLGVHVFFILSGFVIFESALKSSRAQFIAGRVSRLMPAFIVCSAITVLAINLSGGHSTVLQWLRNLTFHPAFLFGEDYVDGVYWTLAYEVDFYFFVLLLMFASSLEKAAIGFCCVWLAASLMWTLGFHEGGLRQYASANYAPLFIEGMMIFLTSQRFTWTRISLLILSAALAFVNEVAHRNLNVNPILVIDYLFIFAAITGPIVLIPLILKYNPKFAPRTCIFLGGLSYPIYLLHSKLGSILASFNTFYEKYAQELFVIAVVLVISIAVYFLEGSVRPRLRTLISSIERLISRVFAEIAMRARLLKTSG